MPTETPTATLTIEGVRPLLKEIESHLRDEIARSASPWCDRAGAAAYCACEVSTIDKAANRGEIKRHSIGSKPMFRKSGKGSLDAWIEGKSIAPKGGAA